MMMSPAPASRQLYRQYAYNETALPHNASTVYCYWWQSNLQPLTRKGVYTTEAECIGGQVSSSGTSKGKEPKVGTRSSKGEAPNCMWVCRMPGWVRVWCRGSLWCTTITCTPAALVNKHSHNRAEKYMWQNP